MDSLEMDNLEWDSLEMDSFEMDSFEMDSLELDSLEMDSLDWIVWKWTVWNWDSLETDSLELDSLDLIVWNRIVWNQTVWIWGDFRSNWMPHIPLISINLPFQPVWTEWGEYSTDLYTSKALDVIQSHDQSKPLFLYLAHQAVHSANNHQPLQAPEDLINKFSNISDPRRRIFAAMVTSLDQSVGKVGSLTKVWGCPFKLELFCIQVLP